MFENISIYSLTRSEFYEAEQLFTRKNSGFWTDLLYFLIVLGSAILELQSIESFNLFAWDNFTESVTNQTDGYHLQNFFFLTVVSIFLLSSVFPKYSPLYRWKTTRDLKNNFIKQENKTITIDETGIEITSVNHREVRQWQDFAKFAENKKIFLLIGQGQNKIIPKRIFSTEEQLNSFRTLLANKIASEK